MLREFPSPDLNLYDQPTPEGVQTTRKMLCGWIEVIHRSRWMEKDKGFTSSDFKDEEEKFR